MRATLPFLACSALLLAGCVGRDIDPPSLGLRAVERQPIPLPDPASEPQVPLDPALTARIAAIEAVAQAGHKDFEATRARVAAVVARAAGAAPGSESWTVAQQELSTLDAARGPLAHAAADMAALRQEPGNATSGNRAAIEAAAARIEILSGAESEALATLDGRLKS